MSARVITTYKVEEGEGEVLQKQPSEEGLEHRYFQFNIFCTYVEVDLIIQL